MQFKWSSHYFTAPLSLASNLSILTIIFLHNSHGSFINAFIYLIIFPPTFINRKILILTIKNFVVVFGSIKIYPKHKDIEDECLCKWSDAYKESKWRIQGKILLRNTGNNTTGTRKNSSEHILTV